MRLEKVKLRNFRCFGEEEQVVDFDKLTTLIGNNSAGKTSALIGLQKILSENSNERNLTRSDFHLPKNIRPEEMDTQDLYIEVFFTFPELAEGDTGENLSIPPYFNYFVVNEEGGKPYLRIRLEASWKRGNSIDGSIESKVSYITCSENKGIEEKDRHQVNRHDMDNIKMIYIPAVRDPSKLMKNVSGSMLYRIMEGINWSEETQESIKEKVNDLNNAFDKESGMTILKNAINTQWKKYDSDNRYTNAEMRFNGTEMESMLKKAEVVFSPSVTGKEYRIDEIGDGLKSLFYISLVDSMLEIENEIRKEIAENRETKSFKINPPILTIVAIEEPENHIAPHLIGKLIKIFDDISEKTNAQTIIASHSPSIIKRIDPETIRFLKLSIDTFCTQVKKIVFPDKEKFEDRFKYVKEAVQAYPEIYFAKLVILGEGDSEEIIIPKLIELNGTDIDGSGISIVPLGGRYVNHFWRLLNDLEIPFITLLDLDRERSGGGWGRIKYAICQLIEIGKTKEELLNTTTGILSDVELQEMHNWPVTSIVTMDSWISSLEKYDVYFSTPLDLDFMMLECFGKEYKSILANSEGPYIVKKGKIIDIEEDDDKTQEYVVRVEHDVKNTLKENGTDGSTYSQQQKQLMIWYNYFFLNRGKPSTHYLALSQIKDQLLFESAPEVLKSMITRIDEISSIHEKDLAGFSSDV